MRIGLHTSTSGNLANAARQAAALGANTFQIFSSSPRMWRYGPLSRDAVTELRRLRQEHDLAPLVIHTSYLINLAAPEEPVRAQSIAALREELQRATFIGAEYLVLHPGSAKAGPLERALLAVSDAIVEAAQGLETSVRLLLECTAGQGASIGSRLEELAAIRMITAERTDLSLGYCLDTCHLLAAGYPIATAEGLKETLATADRLLGLEHVPVIHANDSKGARGSRLDRHAHIGEGHIGLEGFRRILRHPKLRNKAFVLETPVDREGDELRNLEALRTLARR